MADFTGDAPTSAGVVVTERSGAAGTDTVPAGCVLLVRNTGIASHGFNLNIGYLFDGLQVGTGGQRQITLAAGEVRLVRVPATYGDANGRVAVTVTTGTLTEVKYVVIGA